MNTSVLILLLLSSIRQSCCSPPVPDFGSFDDNDSILLDTPLHLINSVSGKRSFDSFSSPSRRISAMRPVGYAPKIVELFNDNDEDEIFMLISEDAVSEAEHARKKSISEEQSSTTIVAHEVEEEENVVVASADDSVDEDEDEDEEIFFLIGDSTDAQKSHVENGISAPTEKDISAPNNDVNNKEISIPQVEAPADLTNENDESTIKNPSLRSVSFAVEPSVQILSVPLTYQEATFWEFVKSYDLEGIKNNIRYALNSDYAFNVMNEMLNRDLTDPKQTEFLRIIYFYAPDLINKTYAGNRRILQHASVANIQKLYELFPSSCSLCKSAFHDLLPTNSRFSEFIMIEGLRKNLDKLRAFIFDNDDIFFHNFHKYSEKQRCFVIKVMLEFIRKCPGSSLTPRVTRRLFKFALDQGSFSRISSFDYDFLAKMDKTIKNSILERIFENNQSNMNHQVLVTFFKSYHALECYSYLSRAINEKRIDLIESIVEAHGISVVASRDARFPCVFNRTLELERTTANIDRHNYEDLVLENLFPVTRLIFKACTSYAIDKGQVAVNEYISRVVDNTYSSKLIKKIIIKEACDIRRANPRLRVDFGSEYY